MSDIKFEVVSYNVNGIGDDQKRSKIFNFLKKQTSNTVVYSCRKFILPKQQKNGLSISGEENVI